MARDTYLYGISIFLPVYAVLFKYLCSREAPETWSCSPLYLIHSNIVFGPFFLGLLPAFEEGELSEALLQPLPPRRQWRPAEAYLFDLLSFIIRKETTYENIPVIQLTTLYNIVQHDRTWQKLLENDSPYTVIHGIVQFDIPSLTWVYMDKRRWAQLHCQDMFDPISEWHFCCRVVVQLVWNTIKQ